MDFFSHQEAARRKTKRLVVLFLLAVAAIIAGVYLVVTPVWFAYAAKEGFADDWRLWDPERLAVVALGVCTVIFFGSAFRMASLRQGGGAAVARLLGGRPVDPSTHDPDERRLLNVVQEMAIASGIPVPDVYLIEDEESINAFAAGLSTDQAVIGVTRGCLVLLSRDELQGVIGHEFSHVLNGDMRLNLRLMGILAGILVIAVIGRVLMHGRRSRSKGAAQVQLAGLGLYVVGYAGVFFGTLIQAAVSRQREFLADASAVQFTRNPGGIAGALKKIGGLAFGSRLTSAHAEEASHFFFGDAIRRGFSGLLSTHPPLHERVARIDPSFEGAFPRVDVASVRAAPKDAGRPPARSRAIPGPAPAAAAGTGSEGAGVEAAVLSTPARAPVWVSDVPGTAESAMAAGAGTREAGPGPGGSRPAMAAGAARASATGFAVRGGGDEPGPGGPAVEPRRFTERVGTLDRGHLDHAVALLEALGSPLLERARSLPGAIVIVHALVIAKEPAVRRRQLETLRGALPPAEYADLSKVLPALESAPREARLPLMDVAVATLRRLSHAQFESFLGAMQALIRADDHVDLFELALRHAVIRHVAPAFGASRPAGVRFRSVRPIAREASAVLSALARCGQREAGAAQGAFDAARPHLEEESSVVRFLPAQETNVDLVTLALDQLAWASPALKKKLITAATACVIWDRKVTMEEAELLRAFADALDCPVPPFIPGVEI